MSVPKVSIIYSNGNLLAAIAVIDGIAGLVGTVHTAGLKKKVNQVFSLADAVSKGYTEQAEPSLYRHLKEFYEEIGGNQELWIYGVDETVTMEDMLDATNADSAIKLIKAANGKIRLLGITRQPQAGYDGGNNFIDADVEAAVLQAKGFCEGRLAELIPLRVLIEGRIEDEASNTIYAPADASNGFAGVVLGGTKADKSASVGLALGRAVKYGAQIKLGKVKNGPLSIKAAFIGSKPISELLNLADLHGKGYISFMQHPNKAGFYFGIDRMASKDDFRLLVYGRVIDKAALIAAAVYVEELESEVTIDEATGKISDLDLEHLKSTMELQVLANMGDQISGVSIFIDPSQDIINTETLKIKVKVTPKGYNSEIEVELGLNAPSVA